MIILEALFFILPTYISNGCASLSMSIPILKKWKTPIDFGHSLNGKRILGDGKTFRGLIFGTFCGALVGILQYHIAKNFDFTYLEFFNKTQLDFEKVLLLSFFLSFGALAGDMAKSVIKRRLGILRGRPWPPFDQLDFIIGGLAFGSIIYFPGWKIALTLVIITPVVHFSSNVIAYLLKLKDVWW
jgi:CDP-2,3-bis-(O-geranylgeranyl)-sn-glycerol synthase